MKMKSLLVIILSALVFASGAYAQNIGDSGLETGRRMKIGKAADVDSTDIADGKVLAWDETSGKFVYTTSLVVDADNDRVGIGEAAPDAPLQVKGTAAGTNKLVNFTDGSDNDVFTVTEDGKIACISGTSSVFVGKNAGTADDGTDNANTFVGYYAGNKNTTGADNSFVGRGAGDNNTTGSYNNFFGRSAGGTNTTGSHNSFIGTYAGNNNTTGSSNIFFGTYAGYYNTTGSSNSFIGTGAGNNNTTGAHNSFVGAYAGRSNTTGGYNSFVGRDAGRYQVGGTTALTVTGRSVFIGYNTKGTQSATNENVFGYEAEGKGSNTVVLGNDDITDTYLKGTIVLEDITLGSSNLTIDNGEIYINGVQKTGL
jgi:hypothetical protein